MAKTFRTGFFRKRVRAVKSVSFTIHHGEIFGLIGPNGAGKSTTIKMLLGLVRPDRGSISMFGQTADDVSLRDRIGYLPENPMLYEHLTAVELLDFYGGLFGMPKRKRRERSAELLELVGLSHALDRPVAKFSKGMKQRAGIAQALINDPDLVILDEPQSGLDPVGRHEIRDLVLQLRRSGKTILFCSHILPDVQDICDRVAVMHRGELKDVGFLHELIGTETLYYEVYVGGWRNAHRELLEDALMEVVPVGDLTRLQLSGDTEPEQILRTFAEVGVRVESLQPHKESLEDVFMRDTADPPNSDVAV
ncbi:ABC transporter ATP-binding protein [Persicimonas caeni]|uniref:ABC transporter ATP-binding protein n=1 Tax=Persicimonas caeni TaxID=2292766 RepID=UPI00143E0CAA|nr:ABC transporter ATP-binding protein [Persicimonas caeni]